MRYGFAGPGEPQQKVELPQGTLSVACILDSGHLALALLCVQRFGFRHAPDHQRDSAEQRHHFQAFDKGSRNSHCWIYPKSTVLLLGQDIANEV
jgi:hypothetical protein